MRYYSSKKRGAALVGVIAFMALIVVIGIGTLYLANTEIVLTQKDHQRCQAFYLAEAGVAHLKANLFNSIYDDISQVYGSGQYNVVIDYNSIPPTAISTGQVGTITRRIQVELSFLSRFYEEGIYACNNSEGNYVLTLRGQGNNADAVYGNVLVHGDVSLYEDSSVNSHSSDFPGNVEATGEIDTYDSASIAGSELENASMPQNPDLLGMNYDTQHDWGVATEFTNTGSDYRLPADHPLYNVVVKNPSDRVSEYNSTANTDDYFLEPASGFVVGSKTGGGTPLALGEKKVYYVDGNVWIHNKKTYGFVLDGTATIVATGDIYICDNIEYANNDSLLGLVALGKYNDAGQQISGGNIYFGDPRYGTTYTVSALMFAADDFLYNTDSISGDAREPQTGFIVHGNLAALDHVSINRDWYTDGSTGHAYPAVLTTTDASPTIPVWIDVISGQPLTKGEIGTMRHYRMQIHYDDRVKNPETQPPALPEGGGTIFAGLSSWREM